MPYARLAEHFVNALKRLLDDPNQLIDAANILTDDEMGRGSPGDPDKVNA